MNNAVQACAYCGQADYRVVVRYPEGTVVRCSRCRLVRTLPYPTFDYQDNKGYAEGYKGRERLFTSFAFEFMDFVQRYAAGQRFLEIGTGMGFLLAEAARRGLNVQGLEVNRWEVAALQARGFDVRQGTLEEAQFPAMSADVVCMSHVLEHVWDLRSLLSSVRRVLRPGGVFAVAQPHYAAPLPRLLGHLWYGWQWEQHLWHFDAYSLSSLLREQKLEPVGIKFTSLYHPWLPSPLSLRPKVLSVQLATAALARSEPWLGWGDQIFLAVRRPDVS